MARKLNTFVTVHRRDENGDMTGESGTFGPDDDLSTAENSWVEAAIPNPHVWEGADDDTPKQAQSSQYESMKLDELKAALADRELPTTGNKADLVARLEADDDAKAGEQQ